MFALLKDPSLQNCDGWIKVFKRKGFISLIGAICIIGSTCISDGLVLILLFEVSSFKNVRDIKSWKGLGFMDSSGVAEHISVFVRCI